MVKLHLKTTCREVPIEEIISTGQIQFFKHLSESTSEFKDQKNVERFRLIYNGRALNEESLKKITDADSIRVVLLPPLKTNNHIEEEQKNRISIALKECTAPYTRPNDRRLHGFNHDFALPDHMTTLLEKHPQLVHDNQFLSVLSDWSLFRAYCVQNDFKDDPIRGQFMYTNPDFLKVVENILSTVGSRYGYENLDYANVERNRPGMLAAQRPIGGAQPVTHALLQNALQAALANIAVPPANRVPAPANVQPAQQQQEEPMQQGYEQQAATLREFGFENDELIQLALEQANGDVQAAMEFLIDLQN
ncbi:UBA domain-containing protein [Caenorhabditis elegans]|uniref:UBA domain-containing protein n=1 Tax=Caenorhabditis elegans TaxID=6239 RepID=P90879_CAEEL|nr:UBA domain-containing protein [Caenorhabditis elegans]CAA92520.1 UBA domain-containing protein [Caenorhabditis elegans]|eukprot:NP_501631.1 Uncharacterized protein CELE_F49C12.9 [Caenorhabditis elegans]